MRPSGSVPRADWGNPALQEDVETEIAAQLEAYVLLATAAALEAEATTLMSRYDKVTALRDKFDKTDLSTTSTGAAQWFKFHGQRQGFRSAAIILRARAKDLRWTAKGLAP